MITSGGVALDEVVSVYSRKEGGEGINLASTVQAPTLLSQLARPRKGRPLRRPTRDCLPLALAPRARDHAR